MQYYLSDVSNSTKHSSNCRPTTWCQQQPLFSPNGVNNRISYDKSCYNTWSIVLCAMHLQHTHTHVYIYVYNIQICTQWYMNTAYDAWIRIVGVSIIYIYILYMLVHCLNQRFLGLCWISLSRLMLRHRKDAPVRQRTGRCNLHNHVFGQQAVVRGWYIDHIYIFSYGITSKHQHVLPQLFIGPFDFKIHPKKNCRTKQKQTHRHTKSSLDVETPRHLHPAPTPTASFVNLSRSIAQFVGEFPLPSVMGVPPSIRDGKITTKTQEIWTWLSPESKPVWEKGSFLVLLGGWMHQVQTSYVIELRSLLVKHITTNSTASTI